MGRWDAVAQHRPRRAGRDPTIPPTASGRRLRSAPVAPTPCRGDAGALSPRRAPRSTSYARHAVRAVHAEPSLVALRTSHQPAQHASLTPSRSSRHASTPSATAIRADHASVAASTAPHSPPARACSANPVRFCPQLSLYRLHMNRQSFVRRTPPASTPSRRRATAHYHETAQQRQQSNCIRLHSRSPTPRPHAQRPQCWFHPPHPRSTNGNTHIPSTHPTHNSNLTIPPTAVMTAQPRMDAL